MSNLILRKTKNNGLIESVLFTQDADGNLTVVDLTATTITMQIYASNRSTILASIAGTVVDAENGTFSVIPGATALNNLENGKDYPYSIKIVNATYPQGLVFELDEDGRPQICTVYGDS